MMQLKYEMLYLLEDPLANQPVRLEPYNEEWLYQGVAASLLQGKLIPQKPLKLRAVMGGRFLSLLWCTFSPIIVISQQLVDLFNVNNFTGWTTYDVEVRDKDNQIKLSYYGFAITGKAGQHDLRRVEVIEKPPITPKGIPYTVLKGIHFEKDYWDGNDFCLMNNNISCIVTEKVVRAFKLSKIRNVRFIQLTQVEIDANVYKVRGLWPLRD
jgi:hypothetical protein